MRQRLKPRVLSRGGLAPLERCVDANHERKIVDVIGGGTTELTCGVAGIADGIGRHEGPGKRGEFLVLAMRRHEGDSKYEH
jgi:hypothetical protein